MLNKTILARFAKLGVAVAAMTAVGAGIGFAVRTVSSDEPDPVAHFDRMTPLPYVARTVTPPNTTDPPECRFPKDERPAPDLPPLPCGHENNQPDPGVIPPASVSPEVEDAGTDRTVINNQAFRFTMEVLDGWYLSMRSEGGEFYLYDSVALEEERIKENLPGGTVIHGSAKTYKTVEELGPRPGRRVPEVQQHLEVEPHNAQFGTLSGAVWETEPQEGQARLLRAAFVRGGILYVFQTNIGDGAPADESQADVAVALAIIGTITPY